MNRAVTPGALFDTGVGDALDDLALEAQEHGQQGQDSEDRGRHRFCVLNGRSSDESTEPDRNALYEPGVRVPSDVSVVGFDDVEESAFATPALTSIRPDKNAIATAALGLLVERIRGSEVAPRDVRVGHRLITREGSTRP